MLDVFKGKSLHELRVDDVRSLLDDTRAEPLHWEAKGVELKPGEVRKQICGFANSHDGGYLILGTHVTGGKWVIDGLSFPDGDPPAWVSNVARGVQPYPENLDTHTIPVAEDRLVAVVWIPSTPTPPCNAHGTVYERVSGKTESVRDPLRLAQLFDRGDNARRRAASLASQVAQLAIYAFGSRRHDEWADRVLFGVGLAASGYEPDIASRLFTHQFWKQLEKVVPVPIGPLKPNDVIFEHHQDAVLASTGERRHSHDLEWRGVATWAGAVGTACAMFDAKSPHIPTLVDYVRTAWSVASDSMRPLRPMGPAYLALRIEHGAGTVDAGELTRGPIGAAVADDLLPGIERELMRLSHRFVSIVPALQSRLTEHRERYPQGPGQPAFTTRNGTRQSPDNIRSRILAPIRDRANEQLESEGRLQIAHMTPHTLRRTFASILAVCDVPPRRAMYLMGHTDPTLTLAVYQQVLDMGRGSVELLEQTLGCTLPEARAIYNGEATAAELLQASPEPTGNGHARRSRSKVRMAKSGQEER